MSESNHEVTDVTDQSLESSLKDSINATVDLDTLPDAIKQDQTLDEALVKHNHLGNGLGFNPASPSRPARLPMKTFEYDSKFYSITARVAPNNTIDFVFKNKVETDHNQHPDLNTALSSNDLHTYITDWFLQEQSMQDLNDDKITEISENLVKLPYTFSINIKPLITVEKMLEVDKESGSELKNIHALVQINFNRPEVDDVSGVVRSIRVNKEIDYKFFKNCLNLFMKAYVDKEKLDSSMSIIEIRDKYIGVTVKSEQKQTPVQQYLNQPIPTVEENKYPKYQKPPPERSQVKPNQLRVVGEGSKPEWRDSPVDSTIELQRQTRQLSQLSYERHQEITAQLRTVQSQQSFILEQFEQLLADNQTLFKVINLLTKALLPK